MSDKKLILVEWLQRLAEEEISYQRDDFNGYDFSGGNYDDAWESGISDGYRLLARELLAKYKQELGG